MNTNNSAINVTEANVQESTINKEASSVIIKEQPSNAEQSHEIIGQQQSLEGVVNEDYKNSSKIPEDEDELGESYDYIANPDNMRINTASAQNRPGTALRPTSSSSLNRPTSGLRPTSAINRD